MSKSYSFSLQKVFDYRKRIEESKALDLSRERMNLNRKMQEYDLLKDRKEKALQNKKKSDSSEKIDLNNLKINKDYIVQINNEITDQSKKVAAANANVEQSREKLIEATKDKKILEKLNDRKYEEYRKYQKQIQNKKDDDVAGRIALQNKPKVSH